MCYTVEVRKQAEKFIESQPPHQQARIMSAIAKLPFVGDIRQLKGRKEAYRLRVGDYRIMYQLYKGKLLIVVVDANMRGQIYRNIYTRMRHDFPCRVGLYPPNSKPDRKMFLQTSITNQKEREPDQPRSIFVSKI